MQDPTLVREGLTEINSSAICEKFFGEVTALFTTSHPSLFSFRLPLIHITHHNHVDYIIGVSQRQFLDVIRRITHIADGTLAD